MRQTDTKYKIFLQSIRLRLSFLFLLLFTLTQNIKHDSCHCNTQAAISKREKGPDAHPRRGSPKSLVQNICLARRGLSQGPQEAGTSGCFFFFFRLPFPPLPSSPLGFPFEGFLYGLTGFLGLYVSLSSRFGGEEGRLWGAKGGRRRYGGRGRGRGRRRGVLKGGFRILVTFTLVSTAGRGVGVVVVVVVGEVVGGVAGERVGVVAGVEEVADGRGTTAGGASPDAELGVQYS